MRPPLKISVNTIMSRNIRRPGKFLRLSGYAISPVNIRLTAVPTTVMSTVILNACGRFDCVSSVL